jgi:nucleobase:cation symporter-1, NCS1 family
MLFDFWVLHKAKYNALALYQPQNIYRYNAYLTNPRAVIAFIVGVAPNLPGFINSINTKINVGVGVHPYQFGWLLGFTGTAIVYCVLTLVWKPRKTFVERAVLPDEVYDGGRADIVEGIEVSGEKGNYSNGDEEERHSKAGEKKGWKSWADRML